MDAEIAWGHVHVSHGHQGATHVDPHRRTLVRMVVIVVARVANVCRSACGSLEVLDALHVFAGIGSLLLLLALVGQIGFVPTCSGQFALRRIPVFVHIDARVHLLRLFWRDCSTLSGGISSWYLVPLALPGTFDPIAL